MLNGHSFNELIDAQKTIHDVIEFIAENKKSEDEEKKSAASNALMAVALDMILAHARLDPIVKGEVEKEAKELIKKDNPVTSVSIPIPTGERS